MRHPSLLTIGLLVACGPAAGTPEAIRTDSAGVEVVMNSGVDRALPWAVTSTDTLFDPASDSTLQGEAGALDLAADATGRLVLADGRRADRRVLVRAPDGAIRPLGRHGDGPGEYELPGGIGVAPMGEVLVVDPTKQGYIRFDAEGHPLPIVRWSWFGRGFSRRGAWYGGGLAVQLTDMGAGDGDDQPVRESADGQGPRTLQTLYLATATDTTTIAILQEPPMKMARFEGCQVGIAWPPVFFPTLLWTGNAALLAVSADGGYRIDIWRGGKLTRSIRREFTPRPVTAALAERHLAPGTTINFGARAPCLIPAAEIVEKQGFAPTLPAIKRLSMAPDGTLWVERWTIQGEPVRRDLFDPSGAYLGTLTGDAPWPQAWMPDGRFVGVGANGDSLPVVVRYRVDR